MNMGLDTRQSSENGHVYFKKHELVTVTMARGGRTYGASSSKEEFDGEVAEMGARRGSDDLALVRCASLARQP